MFYCVYIVLYFSYSSTVPCAGLDFRINLRVEVILALRFDHWSRAVVKSSRFFLENLLMQFWLG